MIITIPVSVGELVDKISILAIKTVKIQAIAKLINICKEKDLLTTELTIIKDSLSADQLIILDGLTNQLQAINEEIWAIEDNIRDHEHRRDFGQSFIQLARGVYHNNDERAILKGKINDLLGSTIKEEKSYKEYKS